jgi:hypothetical protein
VSSRKTAITPCFAMSLNLRQYLTCTCSGSASVCNCRDGSPSEEADALKAQLVASICHHTSLLSLQVADPACAYVCLLRLLCRGGSPSEKADALKADALTAQLVASICSHTDNFIASTHMSAVFAVQGWQP